MSKLIVTIVAAFGLVTLLASGGSGDGIPPFDLYEGVAVHDLDGDGLNDIAVAYRRVDHAPPHPGWVSIYRQDPANAGRFLVPVDYAVGNTPRQLKVADLNRDGLPDIAVANSESYSVSILFQQSGNPGSLKPAVSLPTAIKPNGLAISDINADGWPDIAVGGYGGSASPQHGAAILLHDPNSSESFLAAQTINSDSISESIAAADVDGDGLIDLVLDAESSIKVLRQTSAAPLTFSSPVSAVAGTRPVFVEILDFDGDDYVDILVANAGSAVDGTGASVSFIRQNPDLHGQYFGAVNSLTAGGARSLVAADLNDDGYPDLAVATVVFQAQAPGVISVLLQEPTTPGTVSAHVDYSAGYTPALIAAGDLNGDDHADLATTHELIVLFNDPAQVGTFNLPMQLAP